MANSTIPNLVAVSVPALTDLLGVRQSGDTRDKKLTVTQLLSLGGVSDPLLLSNGSAGAPSYSFSADSDTGMFGSGSGSLFFAANGVGQWVITPSELSAFVAGGPLFRNFDSTGVIPNIITNSGDVNTGLGSAGLDQLSLIAGGVEIARAMEAGAGNNQFAVALSGNSTVPDLTSLGDLDTGIRWTGSNEIITVHANSRGWHFLQGSFFGENSDAPILFNTPAGAAVPTIVVEQSDANTGLGKAGSDALSLISGGVEGLRLTELNSGVIQAPNANVAVTAFATGGQGSATQLDSGSNVLATVATTGDSVKLPPVFTVNAVVFIKNDGANAADVFPASGDNLGAGVDTAVSLAVGESVSFIATVANATWTPWIVSVGGGGGGDVTKVGTPVDNQIGVWTGDGTIEGTTAFVQNANSIDTTLRYRTGFGSSGSPAHSFTGETNSGLFRQSSGVLMMSLLGTGTWVFRDTSFDANIANGARIPFEAATSTNPVYSFLADVDTGIGWTSADILSLIAGGVEGFTIAESGSVITNTIRGNLVAAGGGGAGPMMKNEGPSSTNPVFVPNQADPDTGLTRSGVDRLGLIAGGLECLSVRETAGARQVGFYVTAPISLQTGVAVSSAGIHAALVALGLITA